MPQLPKIPYELIQKIDAERSCSMNLSDKLRVLAKMTINFLVKDNLESVEKNFSEMKKIFDALQTKLKHNPYLYSFPAVHIGPEEYLEALFLYCYIKNKSLPAIHFLKVMPETYLGALSDMTGELVRLAHQQGKKVSAIHNYISQIYELIIPISITRNSQMRTKLEVIGMNLKKIEGIMYDLKLRDKI